MTLGIVGHKVGMTRVFDEAGSSIPVTVVRACANTVVAKVTSETGGYSAVQVAYGEKKQEKISRAENGVFSKLGAGACAGLIEHRLDVASLNALELRASLGVEMLGEVQYVDVSAVSKGKGFQGVIKRWNFSAQDATHGNSLSHRAPGSIGQNQSPGRVFKGKKMAGHMGSTKVTTQNLRLVRVDIDEGLLLIKGAVPGACGARVVVRPALKKT